MPLAAQGRLEQGQISAPFVLGKVETIPSAILKEQRLLNVYLPPGYSPDSAARYPVIYLLDGSADEDFIHVVGLVQFFNFPWINQFPPSIVVGIANTSRKRDFTSPVANLDFLEPLGFPKRGFEQAGGSEKFIAFIEKEVQPFVEKSYKVNYSKTIIGQSLGGLLTTEILLKKPSLFDTYLILSPSLWWNKQALLRQAPALLQQQNKNNIKVYIGVGKEGKMMISDAEGLAQAIKKYRGASAQVVYDYLPNENHATMTHQAIYNAFKRLYPAK
ncbi:alpha/beta hydrolase-fold protein [Hymenobacter saemangeumensis]|uniref:Alpha/beta hydrolase-fold protein n=2 Tax=Hymenobacter saemangeumensis TaxID=1084522 RepID=A0ABP8IKY4_9BACT